MGFKRYPEKQSMQTIAPNTKIKNALILIIVIAAIAEFIWFARFFGSGENAESEKPAVICKPQNAPPEQQECFWTAHIHAGIKVFQDNQEIPLSFEEGELEKVHTHAEKDKLHWHGLIPVDPKIKEVTDWSALSIKQLLKDLGLSIEDGPQIIVNGKEVDLSQTWKDGDIIEITYVK